MYFFVFQAEFDIPEASNLRTKKKILQTVGGRWRWFKSYLHTVRRVRMIQYVKSMALARRSGTSFVRAVKTLRGR